METKERKKPGRKPRQGEFTQIGFKLPVELRDAVVAHTDRIGVTQTRWICDLIAAELTRTLAQVE